MESTVLTPGPGQSVVTTGHGWPYAALDPLIVAEQAAYGRQQAEFAADIQRQNGEISADVQRTVKDSEASLAQSLGGLSSGALSAIGGTNARVERSAADTADRLHRIHRGLSRDIDDAEDGLNKHVADFEREVSSRFCDVQTDVQKAKSKILCKMAEDHGLALLESAKQYADLKATILSDGEKTRSQAADYERDRLRDKIQNLQLQLVAKP